ncbi:MAG: hypothetical protein RLZZ429_2523 [Bacteroidota bacterium]
MKTNDSKNEHQLIFFRIENNNLKHQLHTTSY